MSAPHEPLRARILRAARVGALLGLFEGLAVARWDVWMDDLRPARLALGGAWALATVALEAGVWALLGAATRGSVGLAAVLWLGATTAARWSVGDRFEWEGLAVAPLALALAFVYRPRLAGVLAVALAIPTLWGRVPNYTATVSERLEFLAPLAVVVAIAGVVRSRRAGSVALAAALAAALVRIGAPRLAEAGAAPRKNVLFVLVDTLRQDHVGPWGQRPLDATVSRLAAEGVAFDDAVTVIPKTTQSVAAMQTGKYPVHNGVRILKDRLSKKNRTLAEVLRKGGWRTGAFVHNGWIMRGRGFEQGYGQFWSWFEIERPWGPLRYSGAVTTLDAATTRRIQPFDGNVDARVVTDRAIEWLADGDAPFFAYVHYFDPHWPYAPPGVDARCVVNDIKSTEFTRGEMMFQNTLPESENARARELYAGEVAYTERQVGRLLDWLDASGHADDTLVVFTADHGHHLGDHGYYYHHGEFLYEPGMRIPLVMRLPGVLEAGRRVSPQVRSIDVMPTVLGILGVDAPAGMDGVDALKEAPPQLAFLETDISYFKENKRRYVKGTKGKVRGVRTDRWKLVYTPRESAPIVELYDLAADREEAHDLVAAGTAPPDVLAGLLAALGDHLPEKERKGLEDIGNRFDVLPVAGATPVATPVGTDADPMNTSDLQMLRALGYVE
ncbi:MAG: sulfatase [Myxococcota bacterium]